MPVTLLTADHIFPPPLSAGEEGLLAIGGDLSPERLLLAYRQGIFPWYNENEPILWWFPDPRFVLFPDELRISSSMKRVIKNGVFTFTLNKSFEQVINNCRNISRKGETGTWLSKELSMSFNDLHARGFAQSAEAWQDGELVGGLYGLLIGKIFFGESMFSKVTNASKFAFIQFVKHLQKQGIQLIDCQVYTAHLESLGSRMIDKKDFSRLLQLFIN